MKTRKNSTRTKSRMRLWIGAGEHRALLPAAALAATSAAGTTPGISADIAGVARIAAGMAATGTAAADIAAANMVVAATVVMADMGAVAVAAVVVDTAAVAAVGCRRCRCPASAGP